MIISAPPVYNCVINDNRLLMISTESVEHYVLAGLMVSGFARAGQVLQAPEYTARAIKAASFIRQHLYDTSTGRLLRSCYRNKDGDIAQM